MISPPLTPDSDFLLEALLAGPMHAPAPDTERLGLYALSFEHSQLGKSIRLPQEGIFLINQALCEIFGYQPYELAGIRLIDLCCPDQVPGLEARLAELISLEHDVFNSELRMLHRHGHEIWVHLLVAGLYVERGFRGIMAEFQDISEDKQQASQLRRANARLEVQNEEIRSLAQELSQSLRGSFTTLRAKVLEFGDPETQ